IIQSFVQGFEPLLDHSSSPPIASATAHSAFRAGVSYALHNGRMRLFRQQSGQFVAFVHNRDLRMVMFGFFIRYKAISDNNDKISRLNKPCSRSVQTDDPGASRPWNRIGLEPCAVIVVNDLYLLVWKDVNGFH